MNVNVKLTDAELIDSLSQQVSDLSIGQDRLILQRHEADTKVREIQEQARQCAWQLRDLVGGLSLNLKHKAQAEAIARRLDMLVRL